MQVQQEQELGCACCEYVGYNAKADQYYCQHHPDPNSDNVLVVEAHDKCEYFKPENF